MDCPSTWRVAGAKPLAISLIAALAVGTSGLGQAGQFTQRLVVSGRGGEPTCTQGSESSPEDFVCHPSEAAPTAEERTLVVTAAGHAVASLVVTDDGFGTGRPVIGIKDEQCPAGVRLEDGSQQQIGAKAEFVIMPARGGETRTISATLAPPQAGRFLGKDRFPLVFGPTRMIFALPALDQLLATEEPVDLGPVAAGDRIELRLLAVGTTTWCEKGALRHENISANLWTSTSSQRFGYLATAETAVAWDDKKVPPFKAVVTISY